MCSILYQRDKGISSENPTKFVFNTIFEGDLLSVPTSVFSPLAGRESLHRAEHSGGGKKNVFFPDHLHSLPSLVIPKDGWVRLWYENCILTISIPLRLKRPT